MVVTGDRQHATELRGACRVRVAEHVAAAIDTRAFAVPHSEYAIVLGALENIDLLGPPHGGSGEVFVHAGLEQRVVLFEMVAGFPQSLVEATQRRAAVTRDEAGGVEASGEVSLTLHQRQAHQRLDAGQQDFSSLLDVLVVQRRGRAHG
ncbi:hypothetical protein D3C81_990860 [compost metagenome]